MLKLIVCFIALAIVCFAQGQVTCKITDDQQINLLRDQYNSISQEVEAIKNQSRKNQQQQIDSLYQEVENLINQSKENRQLIAAASNGLYISPHVYIYRLTSGNGSWENSRQSCENWGGTLAVFGAKTLENRRKLIQNLSINVNFWIGLSDIASEGNWIWVNDERADNSEILWSQGQPNNHGENEDCVFVIGDGIPSAVGLSHDELCTLPYQGLCEKMI